MIHYVFQALEMNATSNDFFVASRSPVHVVTWFPNGHVFPAAAGCWARDVIHPQDAKPRHHQDDMVHLEAFIWNRFASFEG